MEVIKVFRASASPLRSHQQVSGTVPRLCRRCLVRTSAIDCTAECLAGQLRVAAVCLRKTQGALAAVSGADLRSTAPPSSREREGSRRKAFDAAHRLEGHRGLPRADRSIPGKHDSSEATPFCARRNHVADILGAPRLHQQRKGFCRQIQKHGRLSI